MRDTYLKCLILYNVTGVQESKKTPVGSSFQGIQDILHIHHPVNIQYIIINKISYNTMVAM